MPEPVRTHPEADSRMARGWSRTFPAAPDQAREARRFLAHILDGSGSTADAVVCLSGLVSNAVLHSRSGRPGGTFTVRIHTTRDGYLRVEVDDQGGPGILQPSRNPQRGHGLRIVSELSRACGVAGDHSGRTLWFEIDRSGS